ncbi:SPFH domain-containing protein [soil metagenome]
MSTNRPSDFDSIRPPPIPPRRSSGFSAGNFANLRGLAAVALIAAIVYGGYFWFVRRVVVGSDEVLVLLRKDASKSLPGDKVIVPRPPDKKDAAAYQKWEAEYGDCNGMLEQVYTAGTYFGFSPWDYEREVINIRHAIVPSDKVGVVIKKFGKPLDPGQVMAEIARDQRGPLPVLLKPGRYTEYANPHAYEVKFVDPIVINPGHRGVVTVMAGTTPREPNQYLVSDGETGTQRQTEPEGFRYINVYERRITPVSIQSQRFSMQGADAIQFPSADSFNIKMEGFVEWSIIPEKLPLLYVQYSEGGALIEFLEEKVILPYSRSFSRLVGSQYTARDFIAGDTKLKFQADFETKLREACEKQGIEILQALVRDIVPPDDIKNPINEREIAKQQIKSLEQQIQVSKSQADLVTQTETATQNQAIGDANKQVVTIVKKSQQERDVAVTQTNQQLEVAKLRLQAAQKEADALVARGEADANVVLLKKQAEAEPLRQQIFAFCGGENYAQFFFYQKVAPAVKAILTNTDGPFAELFKQLAAPGRSGTVGPNGTKVTDATEKK